ncbi:TonB-dependent receptor [Hydrogenovibrio kuenenii]|uniref:TonB-dependent receptor n=1 Tax=Hydrogenovibrio kuenenii TaxID=63658 RepID=UPI0004B58B18|nr:TonB-dependent receptor [Hydrogenovibrio kuenenii]
MKIHNANSFIRYSFSLLSAAVLATNVYADDKTHSTETNETKLAPVTVQADLRGAEESKVPVSTTVMDSANLTDRGANQLEDVLLQTPNVNFAGQDARAKHIQIRGMGERDDYTGAPNPSVGLAIDGIDFSGIGMVSNLFDAKQVEVLRGPQSTRYGDTAIAGLINIQTNDPTPYKESMVEASVGQDNMKELGVMTSGPFNSKKDSPQYRVAIQKHYDDGFRHDAYLNRNDTNKHDELNARGKLRFFPSAKSQLDLTLMHADYNDGYDAWSLDNSFTTLSNQPGKDTQKTDAGVVKFQYFGKQATLISTTTAGNSDMEYSYDGDWAYPGYYTNVNGTTVLDNAYFYKNIKNRKTVSQELRWVSQPNARILNKSSDWLFGLYGLHLEENNHTTDNYGVDTKTDYTVNKLAGFGQLDTHLSAKTVLTTGLRVENHQSKFTSNTPESFSPNETLTGANISLTRTLSEHQSAYVSIARGYKAGGFNPGLPSNKASLTYYKTETAMSYEVGHRMHLANNRLKTQVSLFYMDRQNPQFDGYTYVGNNYVFYTENFDKATNYGLEGQMDWQVTNQWKTFANLGLLNTTVKGTSASGAFSIDNRQQPHAPNYQFLVGGQYRSHGYVARLEYTGMDAFYFSNSNNAKSEPYQLINARVGYEAKNWDVSLWVKNLTDQRYATRGFFFYNGPTDASYNPLGPSKKYIRLGDPRQFGLTTRIYF